MPVCLLPDISAVRETLLQEERPLLPLPLPHAGCHVWAVHQRHEKQVLIKTRRREIDTPTCGYNRGSSFYSIFLSVLKFLRLKLIIIVQSELF